MNAVSLIVAIIGFPLTLLQLWRTKKAAIAANIAAEEAKLRFDSFNALRECDRARADCSAISRAINAADWPDALLRYNALADRLTEIMHSNVALGDGFRADMRTTVDEIERVCGIIEVENRSTKNRLEKSKQLSELRKIYAVVRRLIVQLEGLSS